MTEVATAALAGLSVAEATPQTAANHGMPPGRVRHMFKTLDTDGNGTLSSEELKTGFAKEFKVDALAPHVRAAEARTTPRSWPHRHASARRPLHKICCTGRSPLPSCTLCTLHSVQTLHPLHLSRRRRSWPAWTRCSASTPTRRMARRRPSASPDPAPALALTLAQALALAPPPGSIMGPRPCPYPLPQLTTSPTLTADLTLTSPPHRRPDPTSLASADYHPSGAR